MPKLKFSKIKTENQNDVSLSYVLNFKILYTECLNWFNFCKNVLKTSGCHLCYRSFIYYFCEPFSFINLQITSRN